jgi:FkbM family methyltransferase
MIPDMPMLESTANGVLSSIPEGLTRGEVSAGVYGLGFLGRWALPRLRSLGIRVVACYDANATLTGSSTDGVPVRAASDLEHNRPQFMIVTARHAIKPVSAKLSSLGVPHVSYDAWHVASEFALFRDIHDGLLSDDRSKAVLRAVLMAMLTGDSAFCEAVFETDQYFCLPRFCGAGQDVYVDAGAFVGDSAERFIWSHDGVFSKVYAFEPGPRQFAALTARVGRLTTEWALDPSSIELIGAGLGETDGSALAASDNGQMTSLAVGHAPGAAGIAVNILSLDSFLAGRPITFLKADVEGMEMALLTGAQSTIRNHKPKIAVSVYHYPVDIPRIATYLRGLVPDYQFALRHHSPQLMETVLYCWSESRSA